MSFRFGSLGFYECFLVKRFNAIDLKLGVIIERVFILAKRWFYGLILKICFGLSFQSLVIIDSFGSDL